VKEKHLLIHSKKKIPEVAPRGMPLLPPLAVFLRALTSLESLPVHSLPQSAGKQRKKYPSTSEPRKLVTLQNSTGPDFNSILMGKVYKYIGWFYHKPHKLELHSQAPASFLPFGLGTRQRIWGA